MTRPPADFVDSAVADLGELWDRASATATAEYARKRMKDNLLDNLHRGDLGTVPRAYIERMAYNGHEPAQQALRQYVAEAIDQHRFEELPVGFQEFAREFLLYPNMRGYGRGHKAIDTWTRDGLINFLTGAAIERWKLKKKQAAAIMAIMLKRRGVKVASTRQVLDIYDNRDTLSERVARFMLASIPDDEPEPPPSTEPPPDSKR
jgi:hypothetical protein